RILVPPQRVAHEIRTADAAAALRRTPQRALHLVLRLLVLGAERPQRAKPAPPAAKDPHALLLRRVLEAAINVRLRWLVRCAERAVVVAERVAEELCALDALLDRLFVGLETRQRRQHGERR